jgi:hypothetical protein
MKEPHKKFIFNGIFIFHKYLRINIFHKRFLLLCTRRNISCWVILSIQMPLWNGDHASVVLPSNGGCDSFRRRGPIVAMICSHGDHACFILMVVVLLLLGGRASFRCSTVEQIGAAWMDP